MKVKVAETAGFCFGVKRAVNKVYELIDTEQKPSGFGSSWRPCYRRSRPGFPG